MPSNSSKLVLILVLLLATASHSRAQITSRQDVSQKIRIKDISARLFYDSSGGISADLFTGNVNLWNTVLEGASREGSSSAMLVVVEIEAVGEGRPSKTARVELRARYRIENGTDRGRPAYFQKILPVVIREGQRSFAAFWLYETGCYPVKLGARIAGSRKVTEKSVNLGCGE